MQTNVTFTLPANFLFPLPSEKWHNRIFLPDKKFDNSEHVLSKITISLDFIFKCTNICSDQK